jgi:hypothetical protein
MRRSPSYGLASLHGWKIGKVTDNLVESVGEIASESVNSLSRCAPHSSSLVFIPHCSLLLTTASASGRSCVGCLVLSRELCGAVGLCCADASGIRIIVGAC